MATKKVEMVVSPKPAHFVGDGFRVHNFIPGVSGMDYEKNGSFHHVGL